MTAFKIIPNTTQSVNVKVTSNAQSSKISITGFGGPTGPGVASGGTTGQILAKASNANYDTAWIDQITQENIQDYVAPLFVHNNHTNASVTYEDALNEIHIDVTNAPSAGYTSQVKHAVRLGEAIAKGQAVYVSSSNGTNIVVSKASNATEATSSKTMGLLEAGGNTNAQVNVIAEGLLAGLDTSGAVAGDPVWLGTAGNLIYGLANKPYAPAHLVFIGIVTRVNQNNGEIFIKPQNGFELQEIHNVAIGSGYGSTPADKDLLAFESSTSLWKNKSFSALDLLTATTAASTYAPLTSPTLTGIPLAPTATAGTNTTQIATTAFVSTAISNLIGGATAALDTLNELATALGNDASFATTVTNSLATKANLTGGNTLNGTQTLSNSVIGSSPIIIDAITGTTANMLDFKLNGVSLSAFDSVGSLWVRSTAATFAAIGNFGVKASAATRVPVQIAAATGQSVDLTRWYANDGTTILARVGSTGDIVTSTTSMVSSGYGFFGGYYSGVQLATTATSATRIALQVRGAASQSANLQEWQDSAGTVLARLSSSGTFTPSYITMYGASGAAVAIGTGASTTKAMILQGAASQSVNLLEIQDSSSANLVAVTSSGAVKIGTSMSGVLAVNNTITDAIVLAVRGNPGQTQNLQEWQNSAGTIRSKVDANGFIVAGGNTVVSNAVLSATTFGTTQVGLAIKGVAGQTANLQEWQNSSGTVLAKIDASGTLSLNPTGQGVLILGDASITKQSGSGFYFNSGGNFSQALAGVSAVFTSPSTTTTVLVAKGTTSQSANLQEWQDSTGTVLAKISSSGILDAPYIRSNYSGANRSGVSQTSPFAYLPTFTFQALGAQTGDLTQYTTGAGTSMGGRNINAQIYTGSTTPIAVNYGGVTTAASGDGTTATITTTSAHGLAVGDLVVIAGITPTGYNGTYVLTGVGTNTVSYANTTTGAQTVAGTVSGTSQTSITARSAGTTALVVRSGGFTADAQRWLNSSGNVIASINPYGTLYIGSSANRFVSDNPGNYVLRSTGAVNQREDTIQATDNIGTVRGAFNNYGQIYTGPSALRSATYAITAASASSTTVATFTYNSTVQLITIGQLATIAGFTNEAYYNGSFVVTALGGVSGAYTFTVVAQTATFTVGSATQFGNFSIPAQLSVTSTSAQTPGVIVRGSTSQVTNLQEWQGSGGAIYSRINNIGQMLFGTPLSSTTLGINNDYLGSTTVVNLGIRAAASQTADLTQWQNSSAGTMAKVDANGAFWGKASEVTGYVTSNTTGSNVYQWSKFATFSMPGQFANAVAIVDISASGAGNTDMAHGRLYLSFKQQQAMGTPPEPPTMFLYNGFNVTINDFAAVLVQNDATATRFDLYVRNNNFYQGIYFNPVMVSDFTNIVFYDSQPFVTNLPTGVGMTVNTVNPPETDIIPIDNMSNYFNGVTNRFQITYQGTAVTVKNPFRLMVMVNGVPQAVNTPEYAWQSPIPYDGFFVDNDSFINFSESPQPGYTFDGRIMAGAAVSTRVTNYPFRASDLLLGA